MRLKSFIQGALCPIWVLVASTTWAGSSNSADCDNLAGLRSRADNSDSDAQYELASLYFSGRCVMRDLDQTSRWLARSVAAGNSKAQAFYGESMHRSGNDKEALRLATLSADQGNVDGEALLALLYAHGKAVIKDDYQALKWATLASQRDNEVADLILAELYLDGRGGLKRSSVEADKWLIIAGHSRLPEIELPAFRAHLEQSMTPGDVRAAEKCAAEWKSRSSGLLEGPTP